MSRSGYSDDMDDQLAFGRWRGAVKSAIQGRRGQAFLREMLAAMDALPAKELVTHELEIGGAVCALGSVGKARGIDMGKLDPEDWEGVACEFGIAGPMAAEIVFMNDECFYDATPAERFTKMREWIESKLSNSPSHEPL